MTTALVNQAEPISTPTARAPRLAPGLRVKITLPYATLALILSLAAVYIMARMNAESVATAWGRQIQETQLRVADGLVRAEQRQLTDVRTLARISGLAQAVRAGDRAAALGLVQPYAVSQSVNRVIALDSAGRVVLAIRLDEQLALHDLRTDAVAGWPFVQAALNGTADERGDKYAALVTGGDPALYTIAPLYDGARLSGALLVGTGAQTLVQQLRAASLADVTLYEADGRVIASSFGADTPPALTAHQSATRELALGSRNYTEVSAPLALRAGATPQFIGAALLTTGQADLLASAELLLLLMLAAGLGAAILAGTAISSRITRPIIALAEAAEGVAGGDLERQVPITTRDEVGVLTRSFNTMVEGLRERERMHDVFGRFVSPTVARLVLSRPLALSGETKTLSILFTDLRDFTSMTEREHPSVVISGLNEYFRIVVEAADRYGGIVNKFGGDSTLVLFGLTDAQGDAHTSAVAATKAAIEIRAGMQALNRERMAEQQPELIAGIGINTGTVVAGLIGAERRMEYTVIGDAVNLSARIQALNRELEGGVLVSEATYTALHAQPQLRVSDHGIQQVKGKTQGVRIFAITSQEADHVR